jgi:ssDNA-binding Zn-finger/Zn-ribbon topoisomerase 1
MRTRIGSAYLLAVLIAGVWAPLVCSAPDATPSVLQVVLKDAPVLEALNQVGKAYGFQIIARGIPEDLRVSADIVLSGLAPQDALSAICKTAGLNPPVRFDPLNAYIISGPATATVAGSDVPIIGAVALTPPPVGGAAAIPVNPSELAALTAVAALPMAPGVAGNERMSFVGGDKLVDLEVKDAPIREVMAKLSAASGFSIDVAEPVSNELKITAKIYRMPIADVLSMIVGQANLTYTVSYGVNPSVKLRYENGLATTEELESSRGKPEIHIVPRPELTVSGPGTEWARSKADLNLGDAVRRLNALAGSRQRTAGVVNTAPARPGLTTCPKCKHIIKEPDAKFCPACGAKLPSARVQTQKEKKP